MNQTKHNSQYSYFFFFFSSRSLPGHPNNKSSEIPPIYRERAREPREMETFTIVSLVVGLYLFIFFLSVLESLGVIHFLGRFSRDAKYTPSEVYRTVSKQVYESTVAGTGGNIIERRRAEDSVPSMD